MQKFRIGELPAAQAYFDKWGYVVFSGAFGSELAGKFWDRVAQAIASNESLTYSVHGKIYAGPDVPLEGKKLPRIIDIESHVAEARELMLAPAVTRFLRRWYGGRDPTCLQTLTYKYSSEQGAHSDKKLVSPPQADSYDRETLTAAWFALQASNLENGALIVYPGSHLIPKPDLTWEIENDYGAYVRALDTLCRDHGCEPVTFEAELGDILFWHGDLVHAGGSIQSPAADIPTRKSLVCHYAALPPKARSEDAAHLRVRYRDGSYFHKRAFLPQLRRSWFDRFAAGPRVAKA